MNLTTAVKNRRMFSIHSIHNWIEFNGGNTFLGVYAKYPGVEVPESYIKEDGSILLCIKSDACSDLFFDFENLIISFKARFNSISHDIVIPVFSIFSIWEKESSVGEQFGVAIVKDEKEDEDLKSKSSHLRIVE